MEKEKTVIKKVYEYCGDGRVINYSAIFFHCFSLYKLQTLIYIYILNNEIFRLRLFKCFLHIETSYSQNMQEDNDKNTLVRVCNIRNVK